MGKSDRNGGKAPQATALAGAREPAARTDTNLVAVVGWVAGALVSFSAMALAVRQVAPALGLFDMLAARNIVGILVLTLVGVATGQLRQVAGLRRPGLHLLRNVCHWLATFGWALGVTLMPLATVFALEFTAPAWVTVFAVLFLREKLTTSRLGSVVLGFLGVLVILRPGAAALQPAGLVVLAAAVGFALTSITTKALTRTQGTLTILFWLNVMQLAFNLLAGRLAPAGLLQPYATLAPFALFPHGLALSVVCLAGLSSHWCLTNAYHSGDAILVMPLDFLRIPLIALLGWQFYNEALDPYVFAGTLLIITGLGWNLVQESREQARQR